MHRWISIRWIFRLLAPTAFLGLGKLGRTSAALAAMRIRPEGQPVWPAARQNPPIGSDKETVWRIEHISAS